MIIASYATPQTGTVSGDLKEATRETFELFGGILKEVNDALTPKDTKRNRSRLLGDLLNLCKLNYKNVVDEDYQEIVSNLCKSYKVTDVIIGFCNPPYINYKRCDLRNDRCITGNMTIDFIDDNIPDLTFGFCGKVNPLSPYSNSTNWNYSLNLESMLVLYPNNKLVQQALDYYYPNNENDDSDDDSNSQDDDVETNNSDE